MRPAVRPSRSNIADSPISGCRLEFGSGPLPRGAIRGAPALHVPLPVLEGPDSDLILAAAEPELAGGFTLFRAGSRLAGFWRATPEQNLESGAREAYRELLSLLGGCRIYRAWNFVPHINAVEAGLENYQRFCRGRSLAFEDHFGAGFSRQLSAASAVGTTDRSLAIAFLAGRETPRHFENPAQVPAFGYPPQYGPRPPSFARATAVRAGATEQIFISGTAAIRDHRTVGAGDLAVQLACTLDNLRLIAAAAGAGEELGAGHGWRRTFRIYLRRRSDFVPTRARLESDLLRPDDAAQYVEAEICRADLLIEIEATLTR